MEDQGAESVIVAVEVGLTPQDDLRGPEQARTLQAKIASRDGDVVRVDDRHPEAAVLLPAVADVGLGVVHVEVARLMELCEGLHHRPGQGQALGGGEARLSPHDGGQGPVTLFQRHGQEEAAVVPPVPGVVGPGKGGVGGPALGEEQQLLVKELAVAAIIAIVILHGAVLPALHVDRPVDLPHCTGPDQVRDEVAAAVQLHRIPLLELSQIFHKTSSTPFV